ncbi:hypothetical protein HDU98_007632 [Podochytrium sp. JEL0797]|nr:hypothetical protein HDU98_007632 [Podochytrium sp. JEL0797]
MAGNKKAPAKRTGDNTAAAPSSKKAKTEAPTSFAPGVLDVTLPAGSTGSEILSLALAEKARWESLVAHDKEAEAADDARAVFLRLVEEGVAALEGEDAQLSGDAWHAAYVCSAASVLAYARLATELGAAARLPLLLARVALGIASVVANEDDAALCFEQGRVAVERMALANHVVLMSENASELEDDDEDDNDDNDASDENEEFDENSPDAKRMRETASLMLDARAAFIKCLTLLAKDANEFTTTKVKIAILLRSFALAIRNADKKSPIAISILTFALGLLTTPFDPATPLIPEQDSQDILNATKASCLYYLARFRASGSESDDRGATQDLKECLRSLSNVVGKECNESNQELTGQAYLFLSTVTPNDTLALASFSRGCKLLRTVLTADPSKQTLKQQLESLGASADEEEDEEFEDDDGNAFDLDAEVDRDDVFSDDEGGDGYGDSDSGEGEWEEDEDEEEH